MTEWIFTSSVLILLVLAVRGLFKNRMKAKYLYALWLIVLVRLICPVNFGELSFNLLSLVEEGKAQIAEWLENRSPEDEWEVQKELYASHGTMYVDPENPAEIVQHPVDNSELLDTYLPVKDAEIATQPMENNTITKEINWQKVRTIAWSAGMIVMVAVILSVNISFSTTLGMLRKELPVLAKKGRGKKKLAVYLADGIYSSCLYGVVHPSIYLNQQGLNDREKNYCVEHEYSHYLQGDMVWSLCRTVCLILHWYNPLVWLAVWLSKKDAELACDERTIERLGEEERFSYGHALVELAAAQSKAVQMFGMATLMASDKKEVVDRVKAIATKKQTKLITGLLVAALVIGICFFVFTGEAEGKQDNNNKKAPVATETPVPTAEAQTNITPFPTMDPALEEFIEKSKEERSRNELLTYILGTNKFPVEGNIIATKLNVRSAAGYDADRIDILSEGTTVVINAVEQDADGNYWYAVSYEQKDSNEIKNGYVHSAYLTEAGAVEQPESTNNYNPEHVHGDGAVNYNAFEEIVYATDFYYRYLLEDQTYKELFFADHIKLESTSETGWLIDLDGDGEKDQVSFYKDDFCVNGKYTLKNLGVEACVWLLDIDTTDGMYEILLEDGSLWIYNGSELRWVWSLDTFSWEDGCVFQGTLGEFTRVDAHTISFYNIHYGIEIVPGKAAVKISSLRECEVKEYQYCLNENHEVVTPEGDMVGKAIAMKYAQENETKIPLRLYKEQDKNSEYIEVLVNQRMFAFSTGHTKDGNWWKLTFKTGESGWAYLDSEFSFWYEWYQWHRQHGDDLEQETF